MSDLLVIPNEKRVPSRRSREIADPYISARTKDGRVLPIAVDAEDERSLEVLRGYGTPEPVPDGMETVRWPQEADPRGY